MKDIKNEVYGPREKSTFPKRMLGNRKHSKISRQRAGYRDFRSSTNEGTFPRSQGQWGPEPARSPPGLLHYCSYPSSLRYIFQNLQLGKNCFQQKQLFWWVNGSITMKAFSSTLCPYYGSSLSHLHPASSYWARNPWSPPHFCWVLLRLDSMPSFFLVSERILTSLRW